MCEIGRVDGVWNKNTWSASQHSNDKQSSCLSISKCPVWVCIQGMYIPWPLSIVEYQVREGGTEPWIRCSCVHIIISWEHGRRCRLDGKYSTELKPFFLVFSLRCFHPKLMHWLCGYTLRQVTLLHVTRNWHAFPEPLRCSLYCTWPGTDMCFPNSLGPEVQVAVQSLCWYKIVIHMSHIFAASLASRKV